MSKEPEPKTDLAEIDGPVTPGIGEGAADRSPGRRRFIKVGLGVATPIILTVTSRPAWAKNCATASVQASLNTGGSCKP